MINTLLEHVPIKMEVKDIVETAVNPTNDAIDNDDEQINETDEDLNEDDDEDEESDTESEALEIEQEATMLISSDEEAELEAQRIRFPDIVIAQKLRKDSFISSRSSSRNSQDSYSSSRSQVTYEIITKPDSVEESNNKPRISLLLKNSSIKTAVDICNKENNNSTQTLLKNKTDSKKLDNNKALENNKTKQNETNKSLDNNSTTLDDQKHCENNRNTEFLLNSPGQKSRRGSNNSTCSVASTVASAGAETESCGNIYVFNMQQKLIFNCEFCDLKYGDLENFGRHLHEAHKLFNVDEDPEKENAHCNLRKANRISNNAPKTSSTDVKKEPLRCLDLLAEPPVALPPSVLAEPLDSCGNVFVLNHRKLFLVCGYCECRYANLDLFEKHLRQQHRIFEGCCNEVNVVPKIEVKEEVYALAEVPEKPNTAVHPAMVTIPAEIPLNKNITLENESEPIVTLEETVKNTAEIDKEQPASSTPLATETSESEAVKNQESSAEVSVTSNTKEDETPVVVSKEVNATKDARSKKRISSATTLETPNKRPKRILRNNAKVQELNSTKEDDNLKKETSENTYNDETKEVSETKETKEIEGICRKSIETSASTTEVEEEAQPTLPLITAPHIEPMQKRPLPQGDNIEDGPADKVIQKLKNEIEPNHVKNTDVISVTHTTKAENNNKEVPKMLKVVKRFLCDACPSSFQNRTLLIEHKRLHTGEKPFACDECGKQFRIHEGLKEHKQRHSNERKFKCEICQLGFSTKRDLNLHMRHHINDRRFQCSNCSKSFVRNSDLKIHERIHTGEKPFVCEICHKCFRANQNLSAHRKSHMGDTSRSYKCEHCDKKFLRKRDCKVHMRSHTGEKPFKCEFCQRGFSSKFNIRAHIERDHKSANRDDKPVKVEKESEKLNNKPIDELQNQLLQQIQNDENITQTDQEMLQQHALQYSTITPTSSLKTSITTSEPLAVISSPPPMAEPPSEPFTNANKEDSTTLLSLTTTQKLEQVSPAASTSSSLHLSTPSLPKATDTKLASTNEDDDKFKTETSENIYNVETEEVAEVSEAKECNKTEDTSRKSNETAEPEKNTTPGTTEKKEVSTLIKPTETKVIKPLKISETRETRNSTRTALAKNPPPKEIRETRKTTKAFESKRKLKEKVATKETRSSTKSPETKKFKQEEPDIKVETKESKLKCSMCPKEYARKESLMDHERTHTGEKPFVCEICRKSFRARANLYSHKQYHLGDSHKKYKCEVCGKKFFRNTDRKIHMSTHTNEKRFKCDICLRGYSSKKNVKLHIERDHEHCEEPTNSEEAKKSLPKSIRNSDGKKRYKCSNCLRDYASMQGLKYHMEKEHEPVEELTKKEIESEQKEELASTTKVEDETQPTLPPITPPQTEQIQERPLPQSDNIVSVPADEIIQQKQTARPDEVDDFNADPVEDIIQQLQNELEASDVKSRDVNSVTYTINTELNEINNTDDKMSPKIWKVVKRFFCDVCPSSFQKRSRLVEHKRLHTGEKPFACDECGKQFRIYAGLKEHKLRHSNERKFKCEICQIGCCTKQDLNLHMRHHINDRRFQCASCPKSFVRNSDLKIHERIHTGEKPFVCEICHKCFRANQNLSVHRKSHMGEASRNYKCEHCDKKFLRKIDRKVHMRSHTGEKPFKCEICQRSYSSKFNVRAHIERDHISANKEDKPLKVKKKPRRKIKAVKDELEMHKKLIEELQNQLLQQIQKDEKIIPTDQEMLQQSAFKDSTITVTPSLTTTSKADPIQSAYELLNKLKSSTTTSKPLTVISSPPPMADPPSKTNKKDSTNLLPLTITQKLEQASPAASTSTTSCLSTPSPPKTTATKVVSQKTSLGIQQVSVTVSMQVENVTANPSTSEKETSEILTTTPSGTSSVKKERKITSYFTVVGQKAEV